MQRSILIPLMLLTVLLSLNAKCKKSSSSGTVNPPVTPNPNGPVVQYWLTYGDKSKLLEKQLGTLTFNNSAAALPLTVEVDSAQQFQQVDGYGYTLTGGSAYLINKLAAGTKASLLNELFTSSGNGIGISYLRVSIGASDLSQEVFSYNDLPAGETDLSLSKFNLSKDTVDLIPLLKEILAINPAIKIMGSPWSAPVWMKTNNSSIGGSLKPEYYSVYAQYFVKYMQAMKAKGITIDAITVQNEPQHGGNNPSMVMSAAEQADFIKNHLGPAFRDAGINTKIIVWDHNCDNPGYPLAILNDAAAKPFVDGSAFHLYAGDISALSTVRNAHPDKNIYFTEQWTGAAGSFDGDLKWHIKNVMIGSMRNWAKVALEWNLANDGGYRPHTPGGCTECKGALTLDGAINRNVSYYIVGHLSKFVPAGSVRISSTNAGNISTVAFVTPAGNKVLIALNENAAALNFNIKYKAQTVTATLSAGAVATYVW
ncbi:MAG TPA: glycoside hydrolase family 30 beta sandwich domain-containing protein [Ferruginibacter sp.]|nr:glycoside hydrolase family 30 beta sandwich domain-containing protein [Ferruginibacter sp.]HMP19993.1 glycoside hydrolase family 30 beta sandwich domain-containing protein [Ferruginibacter sp.]